MTRKKPRVTDLSDEQFGPAVDSPPQLTVPTEFAEINGLLRDRRILTGQNAELRKKLEDFQQREGELRKLEKKFAKEQQAGDKLRKLLRRTNRIAGTAFVTLEIKAVIVLAANPDSQTVWWMNVAQATGLAAVAGYVSTPWVRRLIAKAHPVPRSRKSG